MSRDSPAPQNTAVPAVEVIGITGIPEICAGDPIGEMIVTAAKRQETPVRDKDILVVTQKIVSKAEGRVVDLRDVQPSAAAEELARECRKDPRLVELVLRESRTIVRKDAARGIIITETVHGFVCANAGIDASNIPGDDLVSLLPERPDESARTIRYEVRHATGGVDVAIVISDTFGRAWREGHVNFAIGVAGVDPIKDYRGTPDAQGRILKVTSIAVADELAGAAELVMAKAINVPVAIVRGYGYPPHPGGAQALVRDRSTDLFR